MDKSLCFKFCGASFRCVRDQNELEESEARARAFRQVSVSNVLLETSKEVQMLYVHS